MRGEIARGPVAVLDGAGLRLAGVVAGGFGAAVAGDIDHGIGGPPGLGLEGLRAGLVGDVEEAGGAVEFGPVAGFAQVVDAGPDEVAGVGGVVADESPGFEVLAVFGADDFAGGFGGVGSEELGVAVVGADDDRGDRRSRRRNRA